LGAIPPNFNVPLADGGVVDLHNEVKKHEYTLLFFWSSWCHKCEQETPEYKKLYNQYKSKGFEVIGISVDVSHSAWINAIAEKGTTWINSSMLNGWESPVAKGYRVHETPTLFLLNKNKEIVLKPESWFVVRDFLAKNLIR